MKPVESTAEGCRLHLHVSPRSSRTEVSGIHGDRIKVQIAAPPVDGKANSVIEKFLAKQLGVSRRDISWVSGQTGKRKTLDVYGLSADQARKMLGI